MSTAPEPVAAAAAAEPSPADPAQARRLSVGQESLWLLYRMAPDSAAYNDVGAVLFTPAPDLDALTRAVTAVMDRHEVLRSRFVEIGDQTVRVPMPRGSARLELREVPGVSDGELSDLAVQEARRPFELESGGPFRALLLRRETDAALVLCVHHIATDAYSVHLVWRDLTEAYLTYSAGADLPQRPEPEGTFDEFVVRERELLDSPRRAELAEYWRSVTAGARAAALPLDRPRPARPEFDGGKCSRTLPDELYRQVGSVAGQLDCTPFTALFTTLHALLYRYTGQAELLVGCPTSVRRSRSLREVVGLLVNTLVIRSSWTAGTTFAEAAAAVGRQVSASSARAGYPYALMGSGAAGEEPLIRIAATMVVLGSEVLPVDGGGPRRIAGHEVTRLDVPYLEGQFDLNVEFTRSPDSMTVVFRYDRQLFDERTVETLLDRYLCLLESVCADPVRPVSQAAVIGAAERSRLLLLGG